MPQPKRRKLSLEEQDGKESEKNRTVFGSSDNGVGKLAVIDILSTEPQADKRSLKHDRKTEMPSLLSTSSATITDDNKDGHIAAPSRVSSSGRLIKQTNKGRCFIAAREAAQNKQTTPPCPASGHPHSKPHAQKASTPVRGKRGRKRRSWDLWSKFEQDAFFEGLFEHGKDFDAIHNLIVFRSKKRKIDAALVKTKEQVRHLYYRMWQKISKHVHMGDNVKKETQEIYGLVNYYAIRKIFKRIDERAVEHLNELIHTGVSKVRDPNVSGKKNNRRKVRMLRTPICNALKKLNNIEDVKEGLVTEIPQQVTVEFTPRSSAAWLRVHKLSQNPRVRFQVSINRSLASLMGHLCKKWRGPNDRLRENLGDVQETDELVVFPHHECTLKPVTLAPQKNTSVDLITFSSYRNNILDSPNASGKSIKRPVPEDAKTSENSSDIERDGVAENPKSIKSSAKVSLIHRLSESTVQVPLPPCEDENAMFPDTPLSSSPNFEGMNLKTLCEPSSECGIKEIASCDSDEQKPTDLSPETSPQSKEKQKDWRDEERETDMRRLMDAATKGFTYESCNMVTLAHLSLLMEKTAHIRLEYEWHPKWPSGGGTVGMGVGILSDVERLTNMLRRLSNLANMEYRDIMQRGKVAAGGKMSQCTLCGHLLDKSTQRRKSTVDAAVETEPLNTEFMVHPAKLNSNGTLVGMSSRTNIISSTRNLMPDTDGVFRVPMPITVPMSIRNSSPQKVSTQPTFSQLIRPPESLLSKPNFLIPRKRKPQRRPVTCQRTLLPKGSSSPLIFVPHTLQQNLVHNVPLIGNDHLESDMPSSTLQDVQSMTQVSDIVSSTAVSTLCSVHVVDSGTPVVSAVSLPGENLSDMFMCNLNMPVIIPPSSTTKSTQQLIQNSISPSSLTSILDISLSASSNQAPDAGDKFLDMVVNGSAEFAELLKSPGKENGSMREFGSITTTTRINHLLNIPQHALCTPLQSPQHSPLKTEMQWLTEAPELSLSGFLSSPIKKREPSEGIISAEHDLSLSRFLVSPEKKMETVESSICAVSTLNVPSSTTEAISSTPFIPVPPSLFGEGSQDSIVARLDVETALQSVMMESSIDYSSKFEKLAAHLADNTEASQPHM